MRKLILFFLLTFGIFGCTHIVHLPNVPTSDNECTFLVIDERPDPENLYIISSQYVHKAKIEPSLSLVIKNSVCREIHSSEIVTFHIDDFDCIVQGWTTLNYIVDIRGRLIHNGREYDLRANNTTPAGIYIPKGCEDASRPIIDILSQKIINTILATSGTEAK